MNKIQYKPTKKIKHKNILHYAIYIVKPFRSSLAIATLDTMQQVLQFLNISKVNYAKHKFIKKVGYNNKQLYNFYKTFDRIYDINLRLTIHIENFKDFIKPLQNPNKTYIIVTKTYYNHYNNKK